jgi:hypothetical protein
MKPFMMKFTNQNRSCHAERSEGEASPRLSRETLRCAQGDTTLPTVGVKVHYRIPLWVLILIALFLLAGCGESTSSQSIGNTSSPRGSTTPTSMFTEFVVPTPHSSPEAITAGPDGALWFTEWEGGKIGRITP